MGHPELSELSAFADDELEPGRNAEVETHLAGCAPCRTIAADLGSLSRRLAALPRPVPTDHERATWHAAVARAAAPDEKRVLLWARGGRAGWLLAAAVALVVVVAGGLAVLLRPSSSAPSVAAPEPQPASQAPRLTGTSISAADLIADCRPVASTARLGIGSSDQLATLLEAAKKSCSGAVTRVDAGSHRIQYGSELARTVPALSACVTSLYDQTDAPLLPVFAEPATYENQPAIVVVFLTTFRSPALPDDRLDSRQAWVMDETTCTPLNVATD